jgi:hypothetical protein
MKQKKLGNKPLIDLSTDEGMNFIYKHASGMLAEKLLEESYPCPYQKEINTQPTFNIILFEKDRCPYKYE